MQRRDSLEPALLQTAHHVDLPGGARTPASNSRVMDPEVTVAVRGPRPGRPARLRRPGAGPPGSAGRPGNRCPAGQLGRQTVARSRKLTQARSAPRLEGGVGLHRRKQRREVPNDVVEQCHGLGDPPVAEANPRRCARADVLNATGVKKLLQQRDSGSLPGPVTEQEGRVRGHRHLSARARLCGVLHLSDVVVQRGVDFLPSRRTGMVFRANECLRVNTLGVGSSPSRFA